MYVNKKQVIGETSLQKTLSENNLPKAFRPFLQNKNALKNPEIPVKSFNKNIFKFEPISWGQAEQSENPFLLENLFYFGEIIVEAVFPVHTIFGSRRTSPSPVTKRQIKAGQETQFLHHYSLWKQDPASILGVASVLGGSMNNAGKAVKTGILAWVGFWWRGFVLFFSMSNWWSCWERAIYCSASVFQDHK